MTILKTEQSSGLRMNRPTNSVYFGKTLFITMDLPGTKMEMDVKKIKQSLHYDMDESKQKFNQYTPMVIHFQYTPT